MDMREVFDSFAMMGDSNVMDKILKVDIEYVYRMWEGIKAALADAEEREIRCRTEQVWLHQLQDLAYEIDDLVDLWEYLKEGEEEESARSTEATSNFSCKWKSEVQRIKKRFEEIAQMKDVTFQSFNSNIDGSRVYEPIATSPYPPLNSTFVGRKVEKDLLKMLLVPDIPDVDPFQVIGVVGMGGVGKTALCQQIYKDSKITQHFHVTAWVYFGDSSSLKHPVEELTGRILEWFLHKKIESTQLSILQHKLSVYLKKEKKKEKRFLLVLDDVWCNKINILESVLGPFEESTPGSKILVTTSNEEVIRCINNFKIIRLPCLLEEDAQELLRKYANIRDRDRACEEEIISLKCGGLPLAIKNIGNLLGRSRDAWSTIKTRDLWNCGLSEEVREIFGPLYLSYLKLPSNLKACFKFCSLLEKDKEYGTRTLTEMWTAHALMKKKKATLNLVGKSFRNMLVRRSFLEDTHDDGKIKVQNIILDFARYVSGSEFCIIHQDEQPEPFVDEQPEPFVDEQPEPFVDAQHLVINLVKDWNRDQNSKCSARPLRTLIFNADGFERNARCLDSRMKRLRFLKIGPGRMSDWQQKLPDLKHLRVLSINEKAIVDVPESLYELYGLIKLDLSSTGISSVSEQIGNLKNLRAIDLHDTCIKVIPYSICRLSDLEELNLRECIHISTLPDNIGELLSLSLLCLIGTSVGCEPPGLSQSTELHFHQREEGHASATKCRVCN